LPFKGKQHPAAKSPDVEQVQPSGQDSSSSELQQPPVKVSPSTTIAGQHPPSASVPEIGGQQKSPAAQAPISDSNGQQSSPVGAQYDVGW
jgi:hypothetical protein